MLYILCLYFSITRFTLKPYLTHTHKYLTAGSLRSESQKKKLIKLFLHRTVGRLNISDKISVIEYV